MNNFREVNNNILKEWFDVREDDISSLKCANDRKHQICFEEIFEKILKNVPEQNQSYVKKQLALLDDNFFDYICYWNEKYYRNGFCDGVQLISGCFK